MKTVVDILEERMTAALAEVTGQGGHPAIVKPATDPKFGDYQVNGVMGAARKLKINPRHLAQGVVDKVDVSDMCLAPEIAGPGFINLRLKPEFIGQRLLDIAADEKRLGILRVEHPQTVVVDFSSPNVAKQMHVGHLRSTIIGDAICRMLEFEGHTVIRQNHIGDWGTQFGMLVAKFDEASRNQEKYTGVPLTEDQFGLSAEETGFPLVIFEDLYRQAKQRYDSDAQFEKAAKEAVVRLHNHDPQYTTLWLRIVAASRSHYQAIYDTLDVNLKRQDERGESTYNDMLPGVVEELKKAGLAEESNGAVCVFPPGFKTKEGEPLPFIIQKSDGAYLYATTDLAAIRYRVSELKADRIVYVTDARQSQHFQMLFAVSDMAGWDKRDGQKVDLVHVMFGSVLGLDGKPLKTRAGENVKLKELLDEAVERARAVVQEKNPDLPDAQKQAIAKAVGIGAVKYADYSNNRTSDYMFSFDKMLAMEGNTAPYMQYAYARVRSIERKAVDKGVDVKAEMAGLAQVSLTEPGELDLARHLLRYAEAIEAAIADYRPNYLTTYLYELAQKFSVFYTQCPVLDAGPRQRPTRLRLCDLTARTIKHGLRELLGIEVVEQM